MTQKSLLSSKCYGNLHSLTQGPNAESDLGRSDRRWNRSRSHDEGRALRKSSGAASFPPSLEIRIESLRIVSHQGIESDRTIVRKDLFVPLVQPLKRALDDLHRRCLWKGDVCRHIRIQIAGVHA